MKKKHLRYGIGFRPAATLGDVQMAEMVIKPGGREGGAGNRHRGADQWLLVIEGSGHARVNGKRTALKAGHVLVIEKGEEHEVVNDGDVPLKTINVYSPPAYTAGGAEKPTGKP